MTAVLPPDREIYRGAPITEAVIDIRCTNEPAFTITNIARLSEQLFDDFLHEADIVERTEEVRADGARRTTERPTGSMLRRASDGRAVLQLQLEGFTYSRVAPYERWESFRDEGKQLWSKYSEAAKPQNVSRVGVRYLNRLEVGPAIEDLSPYITVYPVTPWGLKSPPAGFSLQIRQPLGDDVVLVINIATIRHATTHEFALMLDFDAFVMMDMPAETETLWNIVERLHVVVQDAFETTITDKVRDLIR